MQKSKSFLWITIPVLFFITGIIIFCTLGMRDEIMAWKIIQTYMKDKDLDYRFGTDEYKILMRKIIWGEVPELTGDQSPYVKSNNELEAVTSYAWKYSGYKKLYSGYNELEINEAKIPSEVFENENVTFVVPIYKEYFSEDTTIQVSILDTMQIEVSENNPTCVVEYDLVKQTEEIICPEGAEQAVSNIEKYLIPANGIDDELEISSRSVQLHESLQIRILGKSSDNCNTTSARAEGVAETLTVTLKIEDMFWCMTEMGCSSP